MFLLNSYYFIDHNYLIILFETKECKNKRAKAKSADASTYTQLLQNALYHNLQYTKY